MKCFIVGILFVTTSNQILKCFCVFKISIESSQKFQLMQNYKLLSSFRLKYIVYTIVLKYISGISLLNKIVAPNHKKPAMIIKTRLTVIVNNLTNHNTKHSQGSLYTAKHEMIMPEANRNLDPDGTGTKSGDVNLINNKLQLFLSMEMRKLVLF